jgi:hypothetical protein
MKFKIYKENGALNSVPVFAALEQGIHENGFSLVNKDQDIDVIWSVLWHGRMQKNQLIYNQCRRQNKPIVIIEVGNLRRGETWRISIDHVHGRGIFGNTENLDKNRPSVIGLDLKPLQQKRNDKILIACQHERSLQWEGQPPMAEWVRQKITEIRKFTDKSIVVRPHPRSPFTLTTPGVVIETPKKIVGSYDAFDIDYNYHCVINHNSGPAVQAAISGIPVICHQSSLAFPVSDSIENIANPSLPAREDWFLKLCHTEWTVDEIAKGIPINRLTPELENYLNNH